MTTIDVKLTTTIKEEPDWLELSPDGRWLALRSGTEWQVIDVVNGNTIWTFSLDAHWIVLSPNGRQIASKVEHHSLVLRDAEGNTRGKTFNSEIIEFIFTPDTKNLWIILYDEQRLNTLALLDITTVTIVDSVEIPFPKEAIGEHILSSYEATMTIHSPSGMLAVTRSAGDTYLDTLFFRTIQNSIIQLPYTLGVSNKGADLRPLHFPCFSASAMRFAALDGLSLKVWQLPELRLVGYISFLDDEEVIEVAFLDNHLLVTVGERDRIKALRLLEGEGETWDSIVVTTFSKPLLLPRGMVRRLALEGQTFIGAENNQLLIFRIELG